MLPIFLFTDFGPTRIYTGLLQAAVLKMAPDARMFDLLDDAPAFDIQSAAFLLNALVPQLPAECVVLAVVDPGVGGARPPLVVQVDGRYLVGPGNGLFDQVWRDARLRRAWRIAQPAAPISQTFHGRDLFAPVAARLALDPTLPVGTPMELTVSASPPSPSRVIYIDAYGNCMTGLSATEHGPATRLRVGGQILPRKQRFEQVQIGEALCYTNSLGLLEIAVNQGSARLRFGLRPGDPVEIVDP